MKFSVVCGLGILFCVSAATQVRADWQLEKENSGIQIHSRSVKGSIAREVRALTTLNADVIRVANFLQDPTTHSRWVPHSQSVSIFERPAPGVTLVHFVMQASWPFQSRDAVAKFELVQTPASVIFIRFDSQPERLPSLDNTVRLQTYSGCWRLTPVSRQSTHLEYRSHIEAGGRIPAWVANGVAIRTTFTAMKNLQQHVPAYEVPADTPLDFLHHATALDSSVTVMADNDCDSAFALRKGGAQ